MTQVALDQNMKALLLQHRNSPVRFVVAFKQLTDGMLYFKISLLFIIIIIHLLI